jgi:hypothetical protein
LGVSGASPALSPAQAAGLDPVDPERNEEEAETRFERPNLQTTHEAENALDAVSSGPSPGVSRDTPLTGRQQGQAVTDMSGRPAMEAGDEEILPQIRDKLKQAKADDKKANRLPPEQQGFRTPFEMGIPGKVVDRIIQATEAPVEVVEVPGGHFFPETGRRYRLK